MYEAPEYIEGATFTVTLGSIVSNGFDIGMTDYPIFDPAYREGLNAKIIEHYWFREIGLETPQLFKRFLNRKMNEIMPFYNQLYRSVIDITDPLVNNDITTEHDRTSKYSEDRNVEHSEQSSTEASTEADTKTNGASRTLVSNTPQMQLSGREDYATAITDVNSKSDSINSTDQKGSAKTDYNDIANTASDATEKYITHVSGLTGMTPAQALILYRESFINIDMLVIDELNELFMGLYSCYENML